MNAAHVIDKGTGKRMRQETEGKHTISGNQETGKSITTIIRKPRIRRPYLDKEFYFIFLKKNQDTIKN